jgi:hypothetical protein
MGPISFPGWVTLAHELSHSFDDHMLTTGQNDAYIGTPDESWIPGGVFF